MSPTIDPKSIAVVVVCHAAYVPFLPEALASWREQSQPLTQYILVLDDVPEDLLADPVGWQVVRGGWGNPNPARNAGLAACTTEWVIFWDADNIAPSHYATNARLHVSDQSRLDRTAVFVPTVRRAKDGLRLNAMGYGDARSDFMADTASVWRCEAVRHVGGWDVGSAGLDDYRLFKDIMEAGWTARSLPIEMVHRDHPERRTHHRDRAGCLWRHRSLGIVCLISGKVGRPERWVESLAGQQLPPRVGVTVMLPEGRPGLRGWMLAALSAMSEEREVPWERLTVMSPAAPALSGGGDFESKHRLVGKLYTEALRATPEDMILTWEDDVFPARDDAIEALSIAQCSAEKIAGVGAVYPARSRADVASAALRPGWSGIPKIADLGDDPVIAEGISYGLTLWSRVAWERAPVLCGETARVGRGHLGLDGEQCARLRQLGYTLLLHGGVRCEHAV